MKRWVWAVLVIVGLLVFFRREKVLNVLGKFTERQLAMQALIRATADSERHARLGLAYAWTESSFNPLAVNGTSTGLFQIKPLWSHYFHVRSPKWTDVQAILWLQDAENNARTFFLILNYFEGRGFEFPGDGDVYELGETVWNKGGRDPRYVIRLTKHYDFFANQQGELR